MHATTLQPAAGAHGELTGILLIRAYHHARGDTERDEVIVPDSSHGTNPATASMAGFRTVTVPSAAGRRRGPRRAPRGAGPPDRGRDAHQPLHAGPVRAAHRGAAGRDPRGGRPGLHGRRQHERHPGPLQAGRRGLRRDALQPAQDVLDAPRRRRPRRRPGGRRRAARAVPARTRWSSATPTGAFRLERPGERPASIGRVRAYQGSVGVLVRAYAYIRTHGGAGPARR